ncbi:MAG TPA: prepilin-type N-terminal cleavage/methylation domain-containing protein [bacterium]|nr:prepilin-type N-terminal cleavage/methylation domain-containing protein [bacterium]
MKGTRGFTLLEIMMVILIMSIMAAIAMPMYADYTAKSRTAEVPMVLKSLGQSQISFYEVAGHYARELATLGWKTNNDLASPNESYGSFYIFSVSENGGCDPGAGALPVPDGLAMATVISGIPVPPDQRAMCMGADLDYKTNEP